MRSRVYSVAIVIEAGGPLVHSASVELNDADYDLLATHLKRAFDSGAILEYEVRPLDARAPYSLEEYASNYYQEIPFLKQFISGRKRWR